MTQALKRNSTPLRNGEEARVQTTIRLSLSLKRRLTELAHRDNRSFAGLIEKIIEAELAKNGL